MVTSVERPGRRRREVSYADFVTAPTETMLLLAHLKNQGHSWRTLADEVNYRISGRTISHALIRRVTLGHCKSQRVDEALGLRKMPRRSRRYRLHYECGRDDSGQRQDALIRAEMDAVGVETFTEYVDWLRAMAENKSEC